MKRNLLGAVLLSIFQLAAPLGIANAADLPIKTTQTWAPPLTTGPLWEGIYVGANIGTGWGRSSWCTDATVTNCGTTPVDTGTMSPNGIFGGGQFGDRWQWGNVVFGLEGMLDASALNEKVTDKISGSLKTSFDGIMSATGSLGWAFDRFLVYGKGGWALTDMKFEAGSPGGLTFLSTNEYTPGWTVGAGIDYQVIPHLIVGVEYDYYRFQPGNVINVADGGGATIPCAMCNFGSTTVQTVLGKISLQAGPIPATW
jgi:outer membrane immunogenic protein